jgi:hypothetical protein
VRDRHLKFHEDRDNLAGSLSRNAGMAASAHAAGGELFLVCPDGHSGIATTVTSCPFAENVRIAYLTQGGPVVVAYSPVTGWRTPCSVSPGLPRNSTMA